MAKLKDFGASGSSGKGEREVGRSSLKIKEGSERGEVNAGAGGAVVVEQCVAESVQVGSEDRGVVGGEEEGGIVEVEEEEVERPLKRRKSCGNSGKTEEVVLGSGKGKGKEVVCSSEKWVSTISLDNTASVRDVDVALYIAEKVLPPEDKKFVDSLNDKELSASLVRGCSSDLIFAFEVYQRLSEKNGIIESMEREVNSFVGQVDALRGELLKVKEERDVLRAQLCSLEEEKVVLEEEKSVLRVQVVSGDEERSRMVVWKGKLEGEFRELQVSNKNLRDEVRNANARAEKADELRAKFLNDCHEAVKGQLRAEDWALELRSSMKEERIEAIKRWKERYLQEECKEYACDLALSILKNCYRVFVPRGRICPSFEEYAQPMLPRELGCSVEEVMEIAEREREALPDELLDLSSVEEEERADEGVCAVVPADVDRVSVTFPSSLSTDRPQ